MPSEKNILYIGRLANEKGAEFLIKAMPKINNKIPDAKLIIIGDGPEKDKLKRLMERLNIEKKVFFVDRVDHGRVNYWYKKSYLVVVPSIYSESFGLIGPEAMSTGRPVVASNIGGIPEWLENGKTGYLVKPGNSEAIGNSIIRLLKNPKLAKRMGENGRKKAEKNFNIKNYAEEIEKIYRKSIIDFKRSKSSP